MYNYDDTQKLLSDIDANVSCAEAHGILCGALSLNPKSNDCEWLGIEEQAHKNVYEQLISKEETAESFDSTQEYALSQLSKLHRQTREQLADNNYEFTPILPTDNQPIRIRTHALSEWCQGFLFGLSVSGLKSLDSLSEACQEVIGDFSAIAQMSEQTEEGEDEEAAYMELVEYLRVGTFTLVDALGTSTESEILH